ncbi:MAG: TolC family protein [Nitrospinae bacterium]|nr:TolC family protein [Nitrospinota bacterium]
MKKLLFGLSLVILPSLCLAAEKKQLGVDEAVGLAMKNNKLLHISKSKEDFAVSKHKETTTAGKPTINLSGTYTRLSDVPSLSIPMQMGPGGPWVNTPLTTNIPNTYALKAAVLQPLFTGGTIKGAEQSADYSAMAARTDVANDKMELAYSVRTAYWNVYKALRVKSVLEKNVQQIQQHLEDVQNMVKAGIILKDEQLKAEVQLSNTRFSLADADNNAKLSMMTLNNIIGVPLDTEIEPTTKLQQENKPLKQLSQYLEEAKENRPDVKAAMLRIDASSSAITSARGALFPQVSLFGEADYMDPNQRYFPATDTWNWSWDVGIAVTYNLLDWGAVKYRVQQAEATRSEASFGLEQLRDSATLDVNQSYLFLKQASDRIAIARLAVEQAEESLRITKNRFSGGFATNTDVLDAEVALLQSQLNLTVATADYEIADARMKKSVGAPEAQAE